MSRGKRWLYVYIPSFLLLLSVFLYEENNHIGITAYSISSSKLPQGLDGYRIVQLSDLQSKMYPKDQYPIVSKVKRLKPDIIVMTGDMVDAGHYDEEATMALMRGVAEIAPVYFAAGNHEYAARTFKGLEKKLTGLGIHVLRNEQVRIKAGDGYISLIGVDDPIFNKKEDGDVDKMTAHLREAIGEEELEDYSILLSHRPELFHVYADRGIDLSFTGHAHGGQFRLPIVGGVYSPGQGMWPELSEGMHERDGSMLVINRGLGNSTFPQRLFNRPEIVLVELGSNI
ncbi:metallophosphoesterase [Paenibacillus sp. J5C_2022]|uniref:metallophosphoesterase n=1 Tax=Paenibacillus sp. J5C2022 TaxID=2977129 RepID=UPI0021D29703|nr:metallophosphoesterase [Paenibacillus sp. J5C2022]MCU6711764.1 metallophosphoesterase [Paenibacillus sp. J5C2022]